MDNIWLLYWITRFDDIKGMLGGFQFLSGVFSLIFAGAFVLFYASLMIDKDERFTKPKKTAGIGCLLLVTLFTSASIIKSLIPSKEDALMIAGGVVLTEIVQSEAAGRIASKSVLVVESWLDKNIPKEEKKQ